MMTKEQILKFCDPDRHPSINRPWSVGDKTYSTNEHVIIRIDRHPEIEERENAADVYKLFAEVFPPQEWFEIPELPKPVFENCEFCFGKGCDECDGEGKFEVLEKTKINGCFFQNKYLRLLEELPNCKISPTGKEKPAWFKFNGGDGLIMPCMMD